MFIWTLDDIVKALTTVALIVVFIIAIVKDYKNKKMEK